MSVPDLPSAQSLVQQSTSIRRELKEWEKAFAASNAGRKAGRDDIKKDTVIAAKYKAYNRLREHMSRASQDIPASPLRKSSRHEQKTARKRNRDPLDDIQPNNPLQQTPQNLTAKHKLSTPTKTRLQHDSPSTLQKLFSPRQYKPSSSPHIFRTSIGPTPQRDGKVLGLFDLLSQSGGSEKSAARTAERSLELGGSENPLQTPSKKMKTEDSNTKNLLNVPDRHEEMSRARRHSRTPTSSGKRFLFSTFFKTPTAIRFTPRKNKEQASTASGIPNVPSTDSAGSDTPAFLRGYARHVPPADETEIGELSPVTVRMPPKLLGRGLSALVQGLRDMEDERMDEELDVLREMEMEEMGMKGAENGGSKVLAKDSQVDPFGPIVPELEREDMGLLEPIIEEQEQPGGRDVEGGVVVHAKPARVWKKKGQKRTTRKSNIKPSRVKPRVEPRWEGNFEDADDGVVAVADVVIEQDDHGKANKEVEDGAEAGEDADAGANDFDDSANRSTAKKAAKTKQLKAGKAKKADTSQEPRKLSRNPNPLAHTNFRALKIKNKNSKGKGKGRFGRRGR